MGEVALVLAKLRSLEIEVYNYREVLEEIVEHPQRAYELAVRALRPTSGLGHTQWAGVELQS